MRISAISSARCTGILPLVWSGVETGGDRRRQLGSMSEVMRSVVIIASGLVLAACSSGSDMFKTEPQTLTLQFESEPQGAEVKTSGGQTCRTPCALAIPAAELTASFTLKGFKPQTIPVKLMPADFTMDDKSPRFLPSPVYAELEAAAPPPKKPAPKKPAPPRRPAAAAPDAGAPPPPPPAAASPWPSAPAPAR